VLLTIEYEANRAQDDVDAMAVGAAADIKRRTQMAVQSLQSLAWQDQRLVLPTQAREWLRAQREWIRIEERDAGMRVLQSLTSASASAR
jgi:two-component system sensor histidine kinase DctS